MPWPLIGFWSSRRATARLGTPHRIVGQLLF